MQYTFLWCQREVTERSDEVVTLLLAVRRCLSYHDPKA